MASANCGVGRELPDAVAVMPLEVCQYTVAVHVPDVDDRLTARKLPRRLTGSKVQLTICLL